MDKIDINKRMDELAIEGAKLLTRVEELKKEAMEVTAEIVHLMNLDLFDDRSRTDETLGFVNRKRIELDKRNLQISFELKQISAKLTECNEEYKRLKAA